MFQKDMIYQYLEPRITWFLNVKSKGLLFEESLNKQYRAIMDLSTRGIYPKHDL